MTYNINQTYPISELANIELWWRSNRNNDINVDEEAGIVIITPRSQILINEARIAELKQLLESTDYVAAKLSEASAIAELTGDKTVLAETYNKYNSIITNRNAWRAELDILIQ